MGERAPSNVSQYKPTLLKVNCGLSNADGRISHFLARHVSHRITDYHARYYLNGMLAPEPLTTCMSKMGRCMEFGMTLAVIALVVAVVVAFSRLASAERRITWLEQEVRRLSGGVQPSAPMSPVPTPPVAAPQPIPVQRPVDAPMPPFPAAAVQPQSQPLPMVPQPATRGDVEGWVGRNLMGVVASLLILAGVTFLGFLVIPFMSDSAKIASMYVLSLAFSAAGILACRRRINAFSQTLLGCGLGALFISVMVTFFVFHAVSSLAFLGLLAAWTACGYVLVKASGTPTMGVIIHIGALIAAYFAWSADISPADIPILVGYQALSTAVICVGDAVACKRLSRLGLLASLGMTLIAGLANQAEPLLSNVTMIWTPVLLIQLAGASVLVHVERGLPLEEGTNPSMAHGLDIAAEIVWGLVAIECLSRPDLVPASISLPLVAVMLAARTWAELKRLALGHELRSVSLAAMFSTFVAFAVACHSHSTALLWLQLVWAPTLAGVSLYMSSRTRDRVYDVFAAIVVAIHVLFVAAGWCDKAFSFGGMVPALLQTVIAMMLVTGESVMAWSSGALGAKFGPEPTRWEYRLRVVAILMLAVGLPGVANELADVSFPGIAIVSIVLLSLRYAGTWNTAEGERLASRWIEDLVVLITVATGIPVTEWALWPGVYCIVGAMVLTRAVGDAKARRDDVARATENGIALCLLLMRALEIQPSRHAPAFAYSFLIMVVALAFLGIGFVLGNRGMRSFGLYGTLCAVCKLALNDVQASSPTVRVAALIVGGLTCFVISALYNRAVRKEPPPQPPQPPLPPRPPMPPQH